MIFTDSKYIGADIVIILRELIGFNKDVIMGQGKGGDFKK